jgi:hypothetical protein
MRSGTFKAVLYWRHRMLLEPGTNGALLTPVHRRRSFRIVSIRTGACKNLQAVPEYASGTGCERPRRGTADPDFPGSAAICCRCLPPVTPEAAGSSPVDPANSFAHAHSLAARRPQASRRSRGAWHESRRPREGFSRQRREPACEQAVGRGNDLFASGAQLRRFRIEFAQSRSVALREMLICCGDEWPRIPRPPARTAGSRVPDQMQWRSLRSLTICFTAPLVW